VSSVANHPERKLANGSSCENQPERKLANVSSCTNHPERKLANVSSCTNHPEEAGQYINPITLYASILVLQYSDWYSY